RSAADGGGGTEASRAAPAPRPGKEVPQGRTPPGPIAFAEPPCTVVNRINNFVPTCKGGDTGGAFRTAIPPASALSSPPLPPLIKGGSIRKPFLHRRL